MSYNTDAMTFRRSLLLTSSLSLISLTLSAQAPGVDNATIAKIRGEAMTQSQAMETHWWLSEGFGPRATGHARLPGGRRLGDEEVQRVGPEERSRRTLPVRPGLDDRSLLGPPADAADRRPLVGQPRWNSPSTNGTVTADVVHVKAATEADLAKYKGQLLGKIVILQAVRAGAHARGSRRAAR